MLITAEKYPQLKIEFSGKHKEREDELVDVDEFIAVKSHRAKGKRLTTFEVGKIIEAEPLQKEEDESQPSENDSDSDDDEDNGTSQMELNF